MAKLTKKQMEWNRERDVLDALHERVLTSWLKDNGLSVKTKQYEHPDTEQAIKIAHNIQKTHTLTTDQTQYFKNFIIKANKGKITGKQVIDIFRQSKAIKRKTVSSKR